MERISGIQTYYRLGRTEHAPLMYVEQLPSSCVLSVEVNDKAADFLDHSAAQAILNRNQLQQWMFLSIPKKRFSHGKHLEQRSIDTLAEEGRAIPVAHCLIPYGDGCIGTTITNKGISLAGSLYPFEEGADPRHVDTTPWGFFGNTDAQWDVEKTNTLLASSFRSSLGLGYIVLDHENLKKFIESRWNSYGTDMVEYLLERIHIVETNGDKVTQYIRLGGPRSRIRIYDIDDQTKRAREDTAIHAQLATGIRLLFHQYDLYPSSFEPYIQGTNLQLSEIPDILERALGASPESPLPFITLVAGIFSHQGRILKHLYATDSMFSQGHSGEGLFAKDVDTSLISYDFEGKTNTPRGTRTHIEHVNLRVIELGKDYLTLMRACNYIHFSTNEKRFYRNMVNALL